MSDEGSDRVLEINFADMQKDISNLQHELYALKEELAALREEVIDLKRGLNNKANFPS